MSRSVHFAARALHYRQLALREPNEGRAENLFALSAMFNAMASEASTWEERQRTGPPKENYTP